MARLRIMRARIDRRAASALQSGQAPKCAIAADVHFRPPFHPPGRHKHLKTLRFNGSFLT
jgi:hypothetical protein